MECAASSMCNLFGIESRDKCLELQCKCCDLEDAFSVVVKADFDSR
jgi:hypothetical protein